MRNGKAPAIETILKDAKYLDYATYAKFRGKIRLAGGS